MASSIEAITQNSTSLTQLNLRNHRLHPNDVAQIALALTHNSSLTSLDLQSVQLRPEGAAQIVEALTVNSGLIDLNLAGNQLGPDTAARLAQALLQNSSLMNLNLSNNLLGGSLTQPRIDGTMQFLETLTQNTVLTHLDLAWNRLECPLFQSPSPGTQIARVILLNASLTHLSLQHCWLRVDDLNQIAGALTHNSSLTSLEIEGNGTQGISAAQFAEMGEAGYRALDERVEDQIARINALAKRNQHNTARRHLTLEERCARAVGKIVFNSYTPDEKSRVYYQIGVLSGLPQVGEHNVFRVDWSLFIRSVDDAELNLQKDVEDYLGARGCHRRYARYISYR